MLNRSTTLATVPAFFMPDKSGLQSVVLFSMMNGFA